MGGSSSRAGPLKVSLLFHYFNRKLVNDPSSSSYLEENREKIPSSRPSFTTSSNRTALSQLAHRNNIRESLHSPFERPHPKDRGMKKRGVVGRINSKHDERERGFSAVFSDGSRDWVTGCVPTPLRSFFRGGTSPLFNKSNTSIDPPQSS